MSLFGWFRGMKRTVSAAGLPPLLEKLHRELHALRKQFLFGAISRLKSEGIELVGVSPMLEDSSELDSALQGFQLSCILGFALKEGYLGLHNASQAEAYLKSLMAQRDGSVCSSYQERYLDCQGDVQCLETALAEDIIRLLGGPSPKSRVLNALRSAASPLAILSQAATAGVFGDQRAEKKLKGLLRLG
jgi:hypothetical protein